MTIYLIVSTYSDGKMLIWAYKNKQKAEQTMQVLMAGQAVFKANVYREMREVELLDGDGEGEE